MTATTGVQLERNDGSEKFNLKCEQVETQLDVDFKTRTVLESAGEIIGGEPVLKFESYKLIGVHLSDIDGSDYPGGRADSDIPNSEHNERMESALRNATKEWGPELANPDGQKFDKLLWNHQTVPIVITSYGSTESAEQPKPGVYQIDMELTHLDIAI